MRKSHFAQSIRSDLVLEEVYEGKRTHCANPKCKHSIKHGQVYKAVYKIITIDLVTSYKGLLLKARYCGESCRVENTNRIIDLDLCLGIQDED